ncbi:hypothetical protein [Aequorivita marisscotiae]|uniref:Uncharacterized protein n=1 Tax=Aequorivita marisscotiae TaxID=3040348 RepID=A0ABY8KWX9_9FLAO|nr:hypothetical protein [Aequorivita sp. Ant34-E75]WGF93656.1 hypothetical protein QCQ61_05555 [Aequorivita sp. Ant34-E75]
MKKIILLLFLIGSYVTFAQDISVKSTTSEVFKDDKKNTSLLFSESDGNGGFITVREYRSGLLQMPKGYYIDHYDAKLNQINEAEIEIDKSQIKGLMINNGTVFLLESALDTKADVFNFNILESSLSKLNFEKRTLFSLDEEEIKKFFGVGIGPFFMTNGFNQMDSNPFGEVTFSAKKNFFCVNFDIKDKEAQTQRLYVFDKDFKPVFEREFKRNIQDRLFQYENIDVDDETGEIYLLGKVFENNSTRTKKKGKANYNYELHKITASTEKSVSFSPDENFIGSLFTVRGKNKISCAGFYSEKNDFRYKGVCRFNLDPETLAITKQSYMPFSEEFIKDKYGKVKDKELKNLSFRSAFINEKEDIVLNAEEFYTVTHTRSSMNGGMSTTTTYHFNDIVSVKMSRDGELLWARNINKNQSTAGAVIEYLSFSSSVIGDDTYLFINCSDKIRKISNDRIEFKQGNMKKANLYAIKIDNNGNYTFKNVVDADDSDVSYFVKQGIHTAIDGSELVFIGRKKSKKQFLKLNIM